MFQSTDHHYCGRGGVQDAVWDWQQTHSGPLQVNSCHHLCHAMTFINPFLSCSDTVSRSGMFCAIATTIDRCKSESMVDIFQVVKAQRMQKPGLVLTAVSNHHTHHVDCIQLSYCHYSHHITTYTHRTSISSCLKLSLHILSHLRCAQANVTDCQPSRLLWIDFN